VTKDTIAPLRLVLLARAAAASPAAAADAFQDVTADQAAQAVRVAESLWSGKQAASAPTGGSGERGAVHDAMRQRAALELRLSTEEQRSADLATKLQREVAANREATETLGLQQKKLKALGEEQTRLVARIGELENQLRGQINETEQLQLKYEKLRAGRAAVGETAAVTLEQMNEVRAENARLKEQIEQTRQRRDADVSAAAVKQVAAEGQTASAEFSRLWEMMRAELPEVFVETHVPTQRTFEVLCEAFVEMLRAHAVLELEVHQKLRDLRQVSEQSDKLNQFYIMLTKNPGLIATLRDCMIHGKRKGNFSNLLRAIQAWIRAFPGGMYKVIVRSPALIAEELNPRNWPIKAGLLGGEEAAIGRYLKETACKTVPESLGTQFRRKAAEMVFEDYDDLMKRR
jgi:hypothetical protein